MNFRFNILMLLVMACPGVAQIAAFGPGQTWPVGMPSGGSGQLSAVGDVDGNGRRDIAFLELTGLPGCVVFESAPGPTGPVFTARSLQGGTRPGQGLLLVDINGDGLDDLLKGAEAGSPNQGVEIFLSTPAGAAELTYHQTVLTGGGNVRAIAVGDFNGDTHRDLVVGTGGPNGLRAYLHDGSLGFTLSWSVTSGAPVDIVVMDFNGDSILDFVHDEDVRLGNGQGGFPTSQSLGNNFTNRLRRADLNGDGIPDLARAGTGTATEYFRVWISSAPGVYAQTAYSGEYYGFALADIDTDGDPDAVLSRPGRIDVMENDGSGGFTLDPLAGFANSGTYGPVEIADLDLDGRPDIVGRTADIRYWLQVPVATTAVFQATPPSSTCSQPISFDASASYPASGQTIVLYTWHFDDGAIESSTSPQINHAFGSGGTHTVQLTVTDGAGGIGVTSGTVAIQGGGPAPPQAHAGGPYFVIQGDDLTLDGSGSTDPDPCEALSHSWDLDNNGTYGDATGRGAFVSASTLTSFGLTATGVAYTIRLRVQDTLGGTSTTTSTVNLVASAPVDADHCDGVKDGPFCPVITSVSFCTESTEDIFSVQVANPSTSSCTFDRVIVGTSSGFSSAPLVTSVTLDPCTVATITSDGFGVTCGGSQTGGSPPIPKPDLLPPMAPFDSWFTVAIGDGTDAILDEVRVPSPTGIHPGTTFGGTFHGLAPRVSISGASPGFAISRIPGIDSDGGADWTAESLYPVHGSPPTNSGPKGTDPRPFSTVLLNEIGMSPDYIEIFNPGPAAVNLGSWHLLCGATPGNGVLPRRLEPFPSTATLSPGAYLVIGDGPTPPAEIPLGTIYVNLASVRGGNIPLTDRHPFELALYDQHGRLVDLIRTAGDDDELAQNHPRVPQHGSDFTGIAGRSPVPSGANAIGRVTATDTNSGSDWRGVFTRTMGVANSGFAGPVGFGSGAAPLDVRISGAGGDFTAILNAGPAAAALGWRYGMLLSTVPADGRGPFLGLDWSAFINYLNFTSLPPWSGSLGTPFQTPTFSVGGGAVRFDLPLGLPAGIRFEMLFFVTNPSGALHARTVVLPFDTGDGLIP